MAKGVKANPKPINKDYLRGVISKKGETPSSVSKKMGFAENYIHSAFNKGNMNDTALRLLCSVIGADYDKATHMNTAPTTAQVDVANGGVSIAELNDLVEIIVSYIQDVGKIQSDIIRELREIRAKETDQLDKLNKTMHDLDVYLRNEGAENRGFHKTVCNYLSGISTCMKIR